jgi:hypothetical protein
MNTTELATFRHDVESFCAWCGHNINGSTRAIGDRPPAENDVAMCIECGGINFYANAEGAVRLPTEAEMDDLRMSKIWPTLMRLQRAILDNKEQGGDDAGKQP